MDLFRGTNLYGATLDRQKTWEAEWEDCRDLIASRDADLGERFTWIEYLTASTHLSSRAFPSTLLSETPSLISTPTSYPVLLPGVDSLNHARAQPVSWVVTHPSSTASYVPVPSAPTISLVLHTRTQRGAELFNNYGPKPNAELILGYGFALPANPDDTIVLKIGGLEGAPSSKWEVGRGARGAEPVWEAVKAAVHAQNRYDVEEEERVSYSTEDDLWATEVLVDMADDLLNRLPPNPSTGDVAGSDPDVRPEVREMLHYYLEGEPQADYVDTMQLTSGYRTTGHSTLIDGFCKSKGRTHRRVRQRTRYRNCRRSQLEVSPRPTVSIGWCYGVSGSTHTTQTSFSHTV